MKTAQRKQVAIVVIVILVAVFFVLPYTPLSLEGGYQGIQASVYGANFPKGGGLISVGNPLSTVAANGGTWVWTSSSLSSPGLEVTYCGTFGLSCSSDQVSYSVGSVVPLCAADSLVTSQSSPCPTISYYSKSQNGTMIHVYGWIAEYQLSYDIVVAQSSSSDLTLSGISWINQIGNFYWNNAYADPTNSSWQGNIFQAPLYAVISSCQVSSTGPNGITPQNCSANSGPNNMQLSPMFVGSQVYLYTNPQITGSWNDLGCSIAGTSGAAACAKAVTQDLNGVPSPSSLINNGPAYFPITMDNVGAYGCGFGNLQSCWPAVHLVITLYTLLAGSFIQNSVNLNTITQQGPPGGPPPSCTSLASCLFLPLLAAGIGLFLLAAIAVVALVAGFYIFKVK